MNGTRIEVETKARVDDPESIEKILKDKAGAWEVIDYQDTYFCRAEVEGYTYKRFRLRNAGQKAVVTAKEKLSDITAEANMEHEFEVSDPHAFTRFVLLHGFRVLIEKRKKGKRYVLEPGQGAALAKPASVEVVNIEELGDFVEVEIMAEGKEEVEAARARIMEIFRELGIESSRIEPRAYTLLLYEIKHGQGGE